VQDEWDDDIHDIAERAETPYIFSQGVDEVVYFVFPID